METFLIFFAIIAIQMIAAYTKQKKEAAKRQAQKRLQQASPQESLPEQDPFKEVREMMGLPPMEESRLEEEEEEELEEAQEETQEELAFKQEGHIPVNLPFQSAAERKHVTAETEPEREVLRKTNKLKIDISKPEQGILWAAILQEPRYRTKWKPLATSH
ncbi:MAG: hypothetical protein FWC26_09785 [Fibromonadales bacterium]|nr:hypothetical protein [Fibromonadales bacterium]